MTVTLEQQLAHFDRRAEQAFVDVVKAMKYRKAEVIAEARKRLEAHFDQYGDTSWQKGYHELLQDELEEAADMLNYRLMRLHRGWPT